MGTQLLHFDLDVAMRLAVLRNSGFEVMDCGQSLSSLNEKLTPCNSKNIGALLVSEGNADLDRKAFELTRSRSILPIVLFQDPLSALDSAQFDITIPSFTAPPDWLQNIRSLLERSAQIRASSGVVKSNSIEIRSSSAALRHASEDTRAQTEFELREIRRQRRL